MKWIFPSVKLCGVNMRNLLLLLLAFSCASHVSQPTVPEVKPAPKETETEVSSIPKPYLTVTSCTNCTPTQGIFIQEANKKLNETVNGSCFKSEVLAFNFLKGWTLNRNNEEVLNSLVGADVKINTTMYYSLKRVLGYTYPNVMTEWLNSRYLTGWGVCELASLLSHETSHKIGYDHSFNYVAERENSVPYALNTIIDKCCIRGLK
jgi:hypothetical protein